METFNTLRVTEPHKVILLDMEPLDGDKGSIKIYFTIATCHQHTTNGRCYSLRLRGGMNNPNIDRKHSDIPMLSHMKFMYDGQPKIDFTETVLYTLNAMPYGASRFTAGRRRSCAPSADACAVSADACASRAEDVTRREGSVPAPL